MSCDHKACLVIAKHVLSQDMCCDHKTCLVWFPIYLAVAHRPFVVVVVVAARPSCARLPVSSPRLFVRSALLGSSRRQTFPFPPSQRSRAVRSSSPLARPAHARTPSARACSFTRRCSGPLVARPCLFHLPSGRPSSARRRRAPVTRTPARQQPALVRSLVAARVLSSPDLPFPTYPAVVRRRLPPVARTPFRQQPALVRSLVSSLLGPSLRPTFPFPPI